MLILRVKTILDLNALNLSIFLVYAVFRPFLEEFNISLVENRIFYPLFLLFRLPDMMQVFE